MPCNTKYKKGALFLKAGTFFAHLSFCLLNGPTLECAHHGNKNAVYFCFSNKNEKCLATLVTKKMFISQNAEQAECT